VPALHQRSSKANACTSVWEGLLGTGTFSADGTEGTGTVRAESLRVSVPEGDLLMTELESNLRVTAPPSELTRGEADFSVARVAWGDETLTLDGLQGRFRGTVEDETAAYALTLGFDELKTRGESFGPVGLDLELRRLDIAALLRLQTLLEELQPAFLTEPAETIGRQVVLRSGALLPQLLRSSPELELHHLIIKTGQGDFFAKGKLVIGDGEPGETFSLPASLVNVRAEGEIDADEALTENLLSFLVRTRLFDTALAGTPEGMTTAELEAATAKESRKELEVLVREGLLTRDPNGYHLLFAYGTGQATLNGKPFPPR